MDAKIFLTCDEVIRRWKDLGVEINKIVLAHYLQNVLPCYSLSNFKWCNPNLSAAIADGPISSRNFLHGKNPNWNLENIYKYLDELYFAKGDIEEFEISDKNIIGKSIGPESTPSWQKKIIDELFPGTIKIPWTIEGPLLRILDRCRKAYEESRRSSFVLEAAYAFYLHTVVFQRPQLKPPPWLSKAMDKEFSKFRLFPGHNEAKFEWLSSDGLRCRWKIDNDELAKCIWNRGLKWYALTEGGKVRRFPKWLHYGDDVLYFDGWIWLQNVKIELSTILKNLDKMAFSKEDVLKFEKENGLGVQGLKRREPAIQSSAQHIPAANSAIEKQEAHSGFPEKKTKEISADEWSLLKEIWREANKLYAAARAVGFKRRETPGEKYMEAVLKRFKDHPREFRYTKGEDLKDKNLYTFLQTKEKMDFVGKLCSKIFERKTGEKRGYQSLYESMRKKLND